MPAPPWLRPDRNPFPMFTLSPGLDRVERTIAATRRRLAAIRARVADTITVARHGLPEGDDW
jgi:hypothetical protein